MKRAACLAAMAGFAVLASAAGSAHPPTYATSATTASLAGSIPEPSYPSYNKKVTLTWWGWTTNPQNVIAAFEKKYPSIHVVRSEVGAGAPEYTKLLTVIKAGSGAPDVVQLAYSVLPQFVATGGLRDLAPLGVARYRPYFLPWTWNQGTQGKGVYGLAEDSGPLALFYNVKIFNKYGLRVPTTWNQYLTEAAKLQKANPHIYMTYFPSNDAEWFLGSAWAAGAQPFSQTGANSWKINLTSAPMLKVATLWDTMIKRGYAQPTADFSAQWAKSLASGQYASVVGPAWGSGYLLGPYVKPNSGWHVAPLPQWSTGSFSTGNWGGSVNSVTTQSKNPDAALLFAAWLNTSAQAIRYAVLPSTKGGRGLWPVDKYAFDLPELQVPDPILDGQTSAPIFSAASKAVNTSFQWSPWTTYFDNQFAVQADKAAKGQESWAQALTTTQAAVTQFGQQQGYTITH